MSQVLVKATPANGIIGRLIAEWDHQLTSHKVPRQALASIRTYEAQIQPNAVYGVYVLCTADGMGGGTAPFDAFVHINHAYPKTPNPVLRLIWSRLAPRLHWTTDPASEHARVFAAIITNALALSLGELKSSEIKFYLYNAADLAFGRMFASTSSLPQFNFDVAVRGAWLHIKLK